MKALVAVALLLTGCHVVQFTAPRTLFAPDARVDVLCHNYATIDGLAKESSQMGLRGWRIMETGTDTVSFLGVSTTTFIVCYEKVRLATAD